MNKGASFQPWLVGLAATGAGMVGVLSNRAGRSGGGLCELASMLGPRRRGDVYSDVAVRTRSFCWSVLMTVVPWLLLRVCFCRSRCRFPVRLAMPSPSARSGAVPPPMRHDRLDPGFRAGWNLRRSQRGFLLHSFGLATEMCGLDSLAGVVAAEAQTAAGSVLRASQGLSCYFPVVQGSLCKFGAAGPRLDVSCAFF